MAYTEDEVRQELLTVLDASKNGSLTTSELIVELTDRMAPSGKDAEIAEGRSDTYFSQKVRNVVSHRNQGTGLVARGLVTHESEHERVTITAAGRVEASSPKNLI